MLNNPLNWLNWVMNKLLNKSKIFGIIAWFILEGCTSQTEQSYDLIIKNRRMIDPETGRDEVIDVAVKGGTIVAIEADLNLESAKVIDATGLIVSPGFIDILSWDFENIIYTYFITYIDLLGIRNVSTLVSKSSKFLESQLYLAYLI